MAKFKPTHPDKMYWPKEKITKGELLEYYSAIAPYILPYLKNRPVMLHRYPNGVGAPGFYQKNLEEHPDWLETVAVEHEDKTVHYPLAQDKDSLLYLVNLATIDFHPFLSSKEKIKNPDYLIFDLDPVDISFDSVIHTAQVFHRLLDDAGVKNFCKTSGGRGLHIVVPLDGKLDFDQAKEIAKSIALLVQKQLPTIISLERSPSNRKGKIYIDYLRNTWGQTTVSTYSVRPRPGAPVSTPLEWKEVKKGLDPSKFTIFTVPKRVASRGDIFKGVLKKTSSQKIIKLGGTMPLVKGSKAKSKKGISENIRREKHAHPEMDTKQAVAIAYSEARRAGAKLPKKKKSTAKKAPRRTAAKKTTRAKKTAK